MAGLWLVGPRAHWYRTDLWALERVAEAIAKQFAVHYHPSQVWRVLRGVGWSCQKPERRARQRMSTPAGLEGGPEGGVGGVVVVCTPKADPGGMRVSVVE